MERWDTTTYDRPRRSWSGRTINVYLHGGMRPVEAEGQFYEEPVLQLHVDHAERSARRERRDRERAGVPLRLRR